MTVQNYLRVLRERWSTVALATLLGVVGALSVFLLRPPEYTADIALYVSAQTGDNPQQAFQGAQLSEQRVKSYDELVTGDRVLGETIRRLGLNQTPAQLANNISSTNATDSVIIQISATEKSPEFAQSLANTVGAVTSEVVADLERPTTPDGVPPVAVRVVQPAPIPTEPSSTGLPLLIGLGLIAGLVVGTGSALLRNVLDTSLNSVESLTAAVGAANLGVIAYDSKVPSTPLTVNDDSQSPRAEAFRQLRTNLQFIDVDHPRKVLLLTSAVPGEGKTTTVANLAVALGSTDERVLVIEADMRRPKLSEVLGVDRSVGLSQVLAGQVPLTRAVQSWGGGIFDVLPSGRVPPNPSELLGSNRMLALLEEARTTYDTILIDTPPLLPVTDAAAIARATDGAILVCRFRHTTRSQVQAAARALEAVSVAPLGTIFTMVPSAKVFSYSKYNYYSSGVAAANDSPSSNGSEPTRPRRGDLTDNASGSEATYRMTGQRTGESSPRDRRGGRGR